MEKTITLMGKEVKVWNKVPYAKKLEAAQELIARGAIFDEELGIAYWSYMRNAAGRFMLLETYTDLDMTPYEGFDGLCALMDETMEENVKGDIAEFCWEDWCVVLDLCNATFESAKTRFERERCMEHKISTSFGFLFDGRDLTESLEEAKTINEEMIDHVGALAKSAKPINMAAYAKKKK